MVDSATIPQHSRKSKKVIDNTQIEEKTIVGQSVPPKTTTIPEEKVEVLIKEIVRINPRDFSAFKHALEEFVADWDK